jgi:hypothetical protein
MNLPRYQIFVSSTFKDLIEERRAVLDAILKLNQFPAGMEIFPAVDDTAWQHIEKVIEVSDYYVLIIGGKYGSIDSESGLSYTEKEYDFAVLNNIPVLAFTRSDEDSIPVGKAEMNEEIRAKLKKFKDKVGTNHHWNYWKSLDELKGNVISSLSQSFVMNPQKGWVKAGGIDKSELLERFIVAQNKIDKLEIENKKLKLVSNSNQNSLAPLSDDEICVRLFDYYSSRSIQVVLSWNEVFLLISDELVHESKTGDKTLRDSLFNKLKLEWKTVTNQLVALDLIKTTFDHGDLCWSLTEKARKIYSRQIAIKTYSNS